MYIYKITHIESGKSYIGQTTKTPKERFKTHCSKYTRCPLIGRALQKYGQEAFILDTLVKCATLEELNIAEIHFIKLFNTLHPNGYNLTEGGRDSKGRIFLPKAPKTEEESIKEIIKFCMEMNVEQVSIKGIDIIIGGKIIKDNFKSKKQLKEEKQDLETDPALLKDDPEARMPGDDEMLFWSTDAFDILRADRKDETPR